MNNIDLIKKIFQMINIAVVGISPKQERPSSYVSLYMKKQGYRIISVNPKEKKIFNEKCYSSLLDIPNKIDIVNVFRRSEYVVSITRDAIAIGAKALWLQDRIINEEASLMAKEAGLLFVKNDCLLRRHKEFF